MDDDAVGGAAEGALEGAAVDDAVGLTLGATTGALVVSVDRAEPPVTAAMGAMPSGRTRGRIVAGAWERA